MEPGKEFILSLETSSPCTSIALSSGTPLAGEIIASLSLGGKVTHSRRLLSTIDWMMKETAVGWNDICAVGVSLGPGSFTGLRIGMATAKGICAAGAKVLLGASTLDALAAKCCAGTLVCALLDARKEEVYAAFYRADSNGIPRRIGDYCVLAPQRLVEQIVEPVLLVGDGAVRYRELFQKNLGPSCRFGTTQLNSPSAGSLGLLVGELLEQNRNLDLGEASPLYIRRSDAELNLLKKNK